ncbi:MAG: hypothetical protein M0Z99_13310 [Betaproteobacteria bacterium]|nr:hypothetical protein [Betaproteobacteria bacterium]
MFDEFLKLFGRVTCGQALAWSVAINAVLATVLFITVASWPGGGLDVPAKAARLEELRNQK